MESSESTSLTSAASAAAIVATVLFWGGTNPFIRRGTLHTLADASPDRGHLASLRWLVTNPSFLVPLLLNFCGTITFNMALSLSDLSIVTPTVNSGTLVMTMVVGWLLGEGRPSLVPAALGVLLVVVGVSLCAIPSTSSTTTA